MDMKPIIVMAGTPVDTQMGMDCLSTQGLPGVFCPISEDPNQQTAFQISPTEEKIDTVVSLLCAAQREHGCEKAFIYCNSLSGALDFQFVARETGLKIVTPLDVYRLLAPKYHSLAVIAANAQGTAGIERTLLSANPDPALYRTSACGVGDRGRRGPRYAGETEPSAGACELVSGVGCRSAGAWLHPLPLFQRGSPPTDHPAGH